MLGRPHIFAHEHDVEVGAVSDFAAAKFSQRDNGENAIASTEPVHENQTRFGEGRVLGENCREIGETKNVAEKNPQQLGLPVNAEHAD